ncbi:MAG: SusC/RagA family TonB-linked outer membrane protein, partial [Chitinophagaceae bacterium]|nr:SusC/RagA family TonB-linked outer membrane protein [Chitinophagaceae bacterium]
MIRKILILTPIMLLCVLLTSAQTHEVTGKVMDSAGAPIPGASINVKGERKGTSADASGFFRIPVAENGVITVSGVGFAPQEINVRNQTSIAVTLVASDRTLNEVVVTALGIRRERRELTNASQTVDGSLLNRSGTGNALSELEGKASGLTVINSTGDPGGGTYIRLRGSTSITGNNQPLMVIDGVPIDNSINNYDPTNAGFQAGGASGSLTGGVQPTNRGADINPNDIESISVLKGPAATALYGIQASSGAIIITTKKGGAGRRTSVTLNSSVTWDKVSQLPPLQTLYAQGTDGQYSPPEEGGSTSWGAKIDTLSWDGATDYPFDKHGNIVGRSDPSAKIPVTPYDRYGDFFKTGLTFNNNVSLAGGNDNSGYRLSLGNVNQSGIIPKATYNKTTLSLSGQSRLSDRLSTSAAINYVHSTNYKVQQGSNLSGIMLGLSRTPATFDNSNGYGSDAYRHKDAYQFPDGSQRNYRGGGGYDNPFWIVNNIPTNSNLDRVFGFGQADYTVSSWMTLTYRLGGDVYAQNDKTSYDINSGQFPAGALYNVGYTNRQFNSDFIVNLHKNFSEDFGGSVILGHNYFTLNQNNVFTNGNGFNVQGFYDLSNAQSIQASETQLRKRTMAFYADAELNYRKMLYLSITGRQETSSTLPAANNTFFYPSVGLGWVFTELNGFNNHNWLSFGKIRGSFAQVGKDAPIYALTTPYT